MQTSHKPMNETEQKNAVDMGMIIAQSQDNAKQISMLREDLTSFSKEMTQAVTSLGDTLHRRINETREASAPNFRTMAAWASVVLGVIGMVATPLFFTVNRNLEQVDAAAAARTLAAEKIEATHAAVWEARISRLENFADGQVAADLQELRERRRSSP
jgi:hypothetical protein